MNNPDVGKAICKLQNQIHRSMELLRPDEGLPRAQSRLLHYIAIKSKEREVYQKDIETEFNLRRASASETLQKLESMHLIERICSKQDKRVKMITITEKGWAHVEHVAKGIQEMEAILQKDLSKEEMEIFYGVIDKMILNCEQAQNEKKGEIV